MGRVQSSERRFAPRACDFWQMKRIPQSPLYPQTRFLRWLHTDSEENYHVRGNKEFSVESVGYAFNGFGYRGPDFETKPGGVGVMFLGDSNTFGVGTPWERLWTSLVTEHLQERWSVPVHQLNLAWGGTGSDYAAMMVHQTVEVLNPAAVFILWPSVCRMTWFPEADRQIHFFPEWNAEESYGKDHKAYLRLATEAHGFFNYVRNFHLVHDRLLRLKIPFYWGTLEPFSSQMLGSYLPLEGYVGHWTKTDFGRDGCHGGLKSHASFANLINSAIDQDRLSPTVQSFRKSRTFITSIRSRNQQIHEHRTGMIKAAFAYLARPIRDVAARVQTARRIRTIKRKDPFIY